MSARKTPASLRPSRGRGDRNALRLRPLDEVGDDQEVAGIFHAPAMTPNSNSSPLAVFVRGVAGRDAGGGSGGH